MLAISSLSVDLLFEGLWSALNDKYTGKKAVVLLLSLSSSENKLKDPQQNANMKTMRLWPEPHCFPEHCKDY